jgi:FtsH-binding integral membrane protein
LSRDVDEEETMTGFNTDQATAAGVAGTSEAQTSRRRSPRRHFWLHFGEMLLAMFAGMAVLGGAVEGVLAMAGSSLSDASASVSASVMAFNMTAPMVGWMLYRGHPVRHSAEMAGSMIVPTAIVIALHLASVLPGDAVLAVQHVVMIPAMLGVMLWRYEHYSMDQRQHADRT